MTDRPAPIPIKDAIEWKGRGPWYAYWMAKCELARGRARKAPPPKLR